MLQSKSILATLLALSFLFSEAQGWIWQDKHKVIGYATVSAEEAGRINEDNKVHVTGSDSPTQLGPGFYIASEPGTRWAGGEDSWYCVVYAKRKKMGKIPKAYIPKVHEMRTPDGWVEGHLWGAGEETIVDYIRAEVPIREAEKALRFAWSKGLEWHLRMLIPTNVVENGNLDLRAQCYASVDELLGFSHERIKWEDWKIKGDPGPKPVSRANSLDANRGLSRANSLEDSGNPNTVVSPLDSSADRPMLVSP